jgi:hypothetical protein
MRALILQIVRSSFAPLLALAFPIALHAQGDTPLIDTRSTTTGQNVSAEQLQNLPSARDPWSVLSTAPGVRPEGSGAPSGIPVSGAVSGDALFTIDGVVVGDAAALGNSSTYVDFDAIQDIQVQTKGVEAEYGKSAGGVIQVVTKSGTNEWSGTGRYMIGGGDPSGLGALTDPGIRIDVAQDATGGYCLNDFQVLNGGAPVPGGTRNGPIRFGFDVPFPIGVGSGSGATVGAGASGGLNLSRIPGCAGQPSGMSFVDARGPVTPPDPTHLFFGQNGVFAVDMGRIGARYGFEDGRGQGPGKLEDTHIFSSNFYLTGLASYVNGGFQLAPQTPGQAMGAKEGFFLYGVDGFGTDDWVPRVGVQWDRHSVRLGDAPTSLPDVDGDGKGDSYFLSLGKLGSACPGVVGGTYTSGRVGGGGGVLQPDADAPKPDCTFLQDRIRMGDYFSANMGVRYDPKAAIQYDPENAVDGGAAAMSLVESPLLDQEPRISGAFQENRELTDRIGGPIIKDRLWVWGSYGIPDLSADEEDSPLFSESFYRRAPNVAELFPHGFYTDDDVQSAPAGSGVQGVGLELRYRSMEESTAPEDGYYPGGATGGDRLRALAEELDSPMIYVVANGGPTGDVFQVRIVQPESGPVAIDGLVAVEPVAATAEDRRDFEREIEQAGGISQAFTAAGYCLNQDLLAPPAGTVYRIASAAKQVVFAPMRRALDAARRLRDAGQLHPDSEPTDYYHSIRQWAVWTIEKGFDREGFLNAFVERTEKNFREAGQPWSADVAAAVRTYGEGRWTDIRAILDTAEASP